MSVNSEVKNRPSMRYTQSAPATVRNVIVWSCTKLDTIATGDAAMRMQKMIPPAARGNEWAPAIRPAEASTAAATVATTAQDIARRETPDARSDSSSVPDTAAVTRTFPASASPATAVRMSVPRMARKTTPNRPSPCRVAPMAPAKPTVRPDHDRGGRGTVRRGFSGPGVELEGPLGLGLLRPREVDPGLLQERPRRDGDLEGLDGWTGRRQLEQPGAVRVEPHLGDQLPSVALRHELQLQQEDRAEHREVVHRQAVGGVRPVEGSLLLRVQAADPALAGHGLLHQLVVALGLHRRGAHVPARHGVDLDLHVPGVPE